MKIIIVGAGTVGFQIARQLIIEGKNVILIEKNEDKARFASNNLDCMVINDMGNNIDILKQAGIKDAQFFISVTDSDEINMITCGIARSEFNVPHNIARVRNIDFFSERILFNPFLGIDYIVNPEIEAAKTIIKNLEYGAVSDIYFFEQPEIQMRSFNIEQNSLFENKSVSQIAKELHTEFLITGIMRDEEFIIPSGKNVFHTGDTVYIIAREKDLDHIFMRIGKYKTNIKKVVLIGAGNTGKYLTAYLVQENSTLKKLHLPISKKRRVKVIDKDPKICMEISEKYHGAIVINADIADESIYDEENLADNDLMITTTDNQELNIISAVYAKKRGVKKTIALINNNNYMNISKEIGIDSIVNPKNAIVNPILKYIRKGNIKSVHSISDGLVELMEISVNNSKEVINKKIKEIKMPSHSLIISIIRGENYIIPYGDLQIKSKDIVILICIKEAVKKIEKMFTDRP